MPQQNPQESLAQLLEVCRLLSSQLELKKLLNTIMDLASHVVGAETASLLLLDERTNELYFDVALGLDPQVSKIRLKMGQGIAGSVAKEGKPVIINDVAGDPRWSSLIDKKSGFQTRSILASPLFIHDKLLGVVEAINHIDGPFSFTDLRIFEAFASQAAVAIDNARLVSSLQEEKSKLDTVFSEMRDGAILTDEAGVIVLANPAAKRFLGLPEKPELLDKQLAQIQSKPDVASIVAAKEPVEFEAVREEPKKLILAGTAARTRSGKLLVFRNVTDEKQEELLKRSFLSLISHKLKTPLASITGYSQLLLEDNASGKYKSDVILNALKTISVQGKKLAELVDRLLRFVTLEDLKTTQLHRASFDMDEVIAMAASNMKPWLEQHKATVLHEPRAGGGEHAFGDPVLIQDVLKNLIENAVKFNDKDEKKVAVWVERAGGFVQVSVRDQGPGIPPEDQEKIFEKFYQVESSFTGQVEGWGLGLSLVKRIIENHGGKVSLSSKLKSGTTISFTLPRPPQEDTQDASAGKS